MISLLAAARAEGVRALGRSPPVHQYIPKINAEGGKNTGNRIFDGPGKSTVDIRFATASSLQLSISKAHIVDTNGIATANFACHSCCVMEKVPVLAPCLLRM